MNLELLGDETEAFQLGMSQDPQEQEKGNFLNRFKAAVQLYIARKTGLIGLRYEECQN